MLITADGESTGMTITTKKLGGKLILRGVNCTASTLGSKR